MIAALAVISVVIPAAGGGGWLWLLPVVIVPLIAGWYMLARLAGRAQQDPDFPGGHRSRSMTVAVVTTVVVVIGVAIVAAIAATHGVPASSTPLP